LKDFSDSHRKDRRSIVINIAKDVTDTMVNANSNFETDRSNKGKNASS
jgi:hypothetical protein